MRWVVFALALVSVVGLILFALSDEFDQARDMQFHRFNSIVTGFACLVVFFVIAVGVGLFLSR